MILIKTICLLCFVAQVAYGLYPLEFIELSRIPDKIDGGSTGDSLIAEAAEAISRRIVSFHDDDDYDTNDATIASSSRHIDDVAHNDAFAGNEPEITEKRNDYYEGRQKKAQRMTAVPFTQKKVRYLQPRSVSEAAETQNSSLTQLSQYDNYYPRRRSSEHLSDDDQSETSEESSEESVEDKPLRRMRRSPRSHSGRRMRRPDIDESEEDNSNSFESNSDDLDTLPVMSNPTAMSHFPTVYHHQGHVPTAHIRRPDMFFDEPRRPSETLGVPSINMRHLKKYRAAPKVVPKPRPVVKNIKSVKTEARFSPQVKLMGSSGYGKHSTRQQFHEQGVNGPHSYKFGYSTGDAENPMARFEERSPDGMVRGSYSYVDPTGKLQVVRYESHPKHGFRTNQGGGF